MENKIVYSPKAMQQLREIYFYLDNNWGVKVLRNFEVSLKLKEKLLIQQPNIGFKSSKNSIYQKTLITERYLLVYRYSKNIVTIIRFKHSSQNR